MYITDKESNCLFKIFVSQRLNSNQASSLVGELRRREIHNGTPAVVEFLKTLKCALITGNTFGLKKKRDGSVSGPFSILFSKVRKSRRDAIACDRICRVYGRWISSDPSQEQWSAYRESIEERRESKPIKIPVTVDDLRIGSASQQTAQYLKHIPLSNSKVVPFTKLKQNAFTPDQHYDELFYHCPKLISRHRKIFSLFWNADYSATSQYNSPDDALYGGVIPHRDEVVGKISALTKDRGLKIRYIANPLVGLQLATSRLQQACNSFLKEMPESRVHDQNSIREWLIPQLRDGKLAWSIDLKSATDNFPLAPQVEVLRKLFPLLSDDIDLWKDISEGDWVTPIGLVRFRTGQPMGVRPSFSAFSITHTLLIRSLGGNPSNFATCGDDVLITDPEVASRYLQALSALDVEISIGKSLMGSHLAEFAGRIYDKHGPWGSYKASPLDLVKDPLGMTRQYGFRGLNMVPPALRPLISFFSSLPYIGIERCSNPRTLDLVDPLFVELFYSTIEKENFPKPGAVVQASIFYRDQPQFQGFPTLWESLVGSGVINNNPVLVDHVLANSPKSIFDEKIPFVEWLAETLDPGSTITDLFDDGEKKFPLSRLKRLFRLVKAFAKKQYPDLNSVDLSKLYIQI